MLRRVAKHLISLPLAYERRGVRINQGSLAAFSTEIRSRLKNAAAEEIAYEEVNIEDLSEFKQFFKNQGWKIKEKGFFVELSKTNSPYHLRILLAARSPMPAEDNPAEETETEGENEEDACELLVYIKKDGGPKWLVSQFVVKNNTNAEMVSVYFVNDCEADMTAKTQGKSGESGYHGPELASLEQKFQQALRSFIQASGVSNEVLQKASQYSLGHEHQFYVDWLKDVKNLA